MAGSKCVIILDDSECDDSEDEENAKILQESREAEVIAAVERARDRAAVKLEQACDLAETVKASMLQKEHDDAVKVAQNSLRDDQVAKLLSEDALNCLMCTTRPMTGTWWPVQARNRHEALQWTCRHGCCHRCGIQWMYVSQQQDESIQYGIAMDLFVSTGGDPETMMGGTWIEPPPPTPFCHICKRHIKAWMPYKDRDLLLGASGIGGAGPSTQ